MTEKFREDLTGGTDSRRAAECDRAEEVVAYLYGETNDEEAARFAGHMAACVSCRDEVAALGGVRERVGEWCAEAVGLRPSLAAHDVTPPTVEFVNARRRSAGAALREFFALSPWWMRAGTAAAALAFCALAVLSVARAEIRWDESGVAFMTNSRDAIGEADEAPTPGGVAQSQIDEMLANHAREVGALRQQLREQEASLIAAREEASRAGASPPRVVAASDKTRRKRRRGEVTPAGRAGDSYLAGNGEDDLPRLYDLLRDVN